jgi:hypothetical protein
MYVHIEPFKLPAKIDGVIYIDFLSEDLSELFEDISLDISWSSDVLCDFNTTEQHNVRRIR